MEVTCHGFLGGVGLVCLALAVCVLRGFACVGWFLACGFTLILGALLFAPVLWVLCGLGFGFGCFDFVC